MTCQREAGSKRRWASEWSECLGPHISFFLWTHRHLYLNIHILRGLFLATPPNPKLSPELLYILLLCQRRCDFAAAAVTVTLLLLLLPCLSHRSTARNNFN